MNTDYGTKLYLLFNTTGLDLKTRYAGIKVEIPAREMKGIYDPIMAKFIAKKESGTIVRTPSSTETEVSEITEKFTTTQINKGAQKSGLTIQEFERLPIDAANVFINGTDQDIQVLLTGIYFDEHSGSDGYVSPDDYNSLKKDFIDAGYSGEDFDRQMALYRNPGNNFYNIGSDSIDWSSLREPEKKNIFQRIKSWF